MDTSLKQTSHRVGLTRIFISFTKIGALLFGGGYTMLPLLEREVVTRRRWASLAEMSDYYAMAQLVPGVIAINTAMLFGNRLRGLRGTLAATLGVVAVPFLVILAYAWLFDQLRGWQPLDHAMAGLRPAVAGLMAGVAWTMFARTRKIKLANIVALVTVALSLICGVAAVKVIIAGLLVGIAWHFMAHGKRA